ncbi:hypothetical protein L3X38_006576 [Prunus dulcis]|uniref:Uncharacterized protein n=1 Tax=Prunus dulcis TaxID=3755 RepID=A0AAD4ZT61_PRUDU|nr:hypothetical protein L3X38_006576 [Prunus dulcis]
MLLNRWPVVFYCARLKSEQAPLYFFEKGNPQITSAAIQGLVELIKTEMQSDSTNVSPAPDAFFSSTLRYTQFQKQKGGVMGEKYAPIKLARVNRTKSFYRAKALREVWD